ncbi:MAG: helix-turn-helix transcriptional regulator [Acidimicrobiales bacterium]
MSHYASKPSTAIRERIVADSHRRAHGLSSRETEVVYRLVDGPDTRAIAEAMFVSEHTVQDHLKSIFDKTGARNRRTLLARVNGR